MEKTILTLEDIIDENSVYDLRKQTIYSTILDENIGTEILVPDTDTFKTYYTYVSEFVAKFMMTEAECNVYSYRPTHLSRQFYGTAKLDWLIMRLNNCEGPSQFKLVPGTYLKMIIPSNLTKLFDIIIPKHSSRIKDNWSEHSISY